jgi:AraC family transcriptional regulator of adaptative response/methylated-DNA-[protein]-cysteine methyltransferase
MPDFRQLAGSLGRPAAARAVANAVAANPVNYLIPCHRVLRANGDIGGFRGGSETKRRLLEWEAAGAAQQSATARDTDASTRPSMRR